MRERIEQVILGLVATLSIIISVLHWLDWLPPDAFHIPSLTLLALGLIAGYLVVERRVKVDDVKHLVAGGTERIIRSLDGVAVRRFATVQEVYEYMVKRMQEAESTIDDLTFGFKDPPATPTTKKARERYLETIVRVCSQRKRTISYREVMSFPPLTHVTRAESMLRQNLPAYRLRYYEFTQKHLPALLSFMVIDSSEVILAFYRAPYLPSEREILLAVKHPDIVKLFQDYYDAIWQGAKILKEADKAELALLQEIERRVSRILDGS